MHQQNIRIFYHTFLPTNTQDNQNKILLLTFYKQTKITNSSK